MASVEKQPLMTSAPIHAPPAYAAGKGGNQLDSLTTQKLAAVNRFGFQEGKFTSALCCGICANSYLVTDRERQTQVPGRPEGEIVDNPLWLVEEQSECFHRCLCFGKHPILAKFYHAGPVRAGETICGCCYSGHVYTKDTTQPVSMTLERDGLCNKCIGCPICMPCCMSEAWLHSGEVDGKPGTIATQQGGRVIGRSVNPADGGCFTPTLNIYDNEQGGERHFGDLTGPCFFGGCLDLCADTNFKLSSSAQPKGGDLGQIVKQKPDSCLEMCCQFANDADNYNIDFFGKPLTPMQKANMLGTAVHLDYWFYSRDARPLTCHDNGDGSGVIVITLCNMYCRGCVIPIQIPIPYGSKK